MKLYKKLPKLSIIICLIYIIGSICILQRPIEACRIFGMEKYLNYSAEHLGYIVVNDVYASGFAYSNYYSLAAYVIIAQMLVIILAAALTIYRKANPLSVFLSTAAFPALYTIQFVGEFIDDWGFNESLSELLNYNIFVSVCRCWLVLAFCGASLCAISAFCGTKNTRPAHLAFLSNFVLGAFLILTTGVVILEQPKEHYFPMLVIPYLVSDCVLILINILSLRGRSSQGTALIAVALAAFLPVGAYLVNMFLSGDYYGFMSLNNSYGSIDIFLPLWHVGACLSASSPIKATSEIEIPDINCYSES